MMPQTAPNAIGNRQHVVIPSGVANLSADLSHAANNGFTILKRLETVPLAGGPRVAGARKSRQPNTFRASVGSYFLLALPARGRRASATRPLAIPGDWHGFPLRARAARHFASWGIGDSMGLFLSARPIFDRFEL